MAFLKRESKATLPKWMRVARIPEPKDVEEFNIENTVAGEYEDLHQYAQQYQRKTGKSFWESITPTDDLSNL